MRFLNRSAVACAVATCLLGSALSGCVIAPPVATGRALPESYRGDAYAVRDWQNRGLYEPPAGYGWQYVDGQYVLVAVATGIVAATLLGALLAGHGGHGPGPGPR